MTEMLRVIVVDDEPIAREGLSVRLGRLGGVMVVAECGSAAEGIEALTRHDVDVAFVDIQMAGVDGFGLIERMHRAFLPAVIFVTAHDEHALRAFRVGAFDYLLKPFDDATLRSSVERVRTFVRLARGGTLVVAAGEPLVIRTEGRVVVLHGADIDWVEAVGDRVRVHTPRETYLLRATMRVIEGRLDPARFVRIHRGAIVALPLIRELQPYSRGEHVVVLADGTKLPLSRRHRPRLLRALGPPA